MSFMIHNIVWLELKACNPAGEDDNAAQDTCND